MANADHFYSTSLTEANAAVQNAGYNAEGQEGYVLTKKNIAFSNMIAIYRFYNGHDHFYCRDKSEGEDAKGYHFERIAFYVRGIPPQPKFVDYWIPLYRMYSKKDSDHFYTTAPNRTEANKAGYNDEGIIGWVMAQPPAYPQHASPLLRLYKRGTSSSSFFSLKTLGTALMVVQIVGKFFEVLAPIFSGGGEGESEYDTQTDSQGNLLVAKNP